MALMFSISTAHFVATVSYDSSQLLHRDAPVNGGDPRVAVSTILEITNCIIGDIILIWRVWAVWIHRKRAIVVPTFFWVASIVSTIFFVNNLIGSGEGEVYFAMSSNLSAYWGLVFLVSTFMTNFTALGAICYRYWLYWKEIGSVLRPNDNNIRHVFSLLIESGFFYCIALVTLAISYLAGGEVICYILVNVITQLTAIYPILIIVLVCLKMTQRDHIEHFKSETLQFHRKTGDFCMGRSEISTRALESIAIQTYSGVHDDDVISGSASKLDGSPSTNVFSVHCPTSARDSRHRGRHSIG